MLVILVILVGVIVDRVNTSRTSATRDVRVVVQAEGVNCARDVGLYVRFIKRVGLAVIRSSCFAFCLTLVLKPNSDRLDFPARNASVLGTLIIIRVSRVHRNNRAMKKHE
jgi:hypothetical protein